jgi:hypothetical protein
MSDLYAPIRTAIIEDSVINPQLSEWQGEPACFTRRPVPEDVRHIFCLINPPADRRDIDALNSRRDLYSINVAFYGTKADARDPADQTRMVDVLAERAFNLFHRNKWAIQSDAFQIIDIVASGPFAGPTDDDNEVSRIVNLRVRLGRNQ